MALTRKQRTQLNLVPTSELKSASDSPSAFGSHALAAVRESAQYDFGPFDDMMSKILVPLTGQYPDLQRLVDVGSRIMRPGPDGDDHRRAFKAEELFGGGAGRRPTAYAVQLDGIRVILGLTSAGKATIEGGSDNEWVTVLAEQVRAHQPSVFYTGPFSRIVRNKDLSGRLKTAFKVTGTKLVCFEWPSGFDMSEPIGDMAWELLAQAAHWDWMATLTRLQMGALHHLKDGRFPRSEVTLPPGYVKVVSEDGRSRVVPDPTMRDKVRLLIDLASEDLPDDVLVKRLGDAGFTARGVGTHGMNLSEVAVPRTALDLLWQYLETYQTGIYKYLQKNTVPGCTSMLGKEVHKETATDMGYFLFDLEFGLPEGGWHDDEAIARAIEHRNRKAPKRGPGTKDRKPLLSLCAYRTEGAEYRLLSDDASYALRCRPSDSDDTLATKFGPFEGEVAGRFSAPRLHKVIAGLLRDATRFAPIDLPVLEPPEGELERALELEQEADEFDVVAADLRRQAAACGPDMDDLAATFRAEAAEAMKEAKARRAQAAMRRANVKGIRIGDELKVDARKLLVAAELLDRTEGLASPEVCQLVRQVVADLRFTAKRGEARAEVYLTVRLHTDAGMILVGPLSTVMRNGAGRRRDPGQAVTVRNAGLLRDYLSGDLGEFGEIEGLVDRSERRRMIDALQPLLPHPETARVIIDCPIREVRCAVTGPVFIKAGRDPLPGYEELDGIWAAEMQSVYLGDTWTWLPDTWAARDYTRQRQALAWMGRHVNEEGIDSRELMAKLHLSDPDFYWLLSLDHYRYAKRRAGTWAPLEYVNPHTKHAPSQDGSNRLVRLRACPHCETRNPGQLLRVPELPQGWLCGTCLKAPGSTIAWPTAYLEPWVGSLLGNSPTKTDEERAGHITHGTCAKHFLPPPFAGL